MASRSEREAYPWEMGQCVPLPFMSVFAHYTLTRVLSEMEGTLVASPPLSHHIVTQLLQAASTGQSVIQSGGTGRQTCADLQHMTPVESNGGQSDKKAVGYHPKVPGRGQRIVLQRSFAALSSAIPVPLSAECPFTLRHTPMMDTHR
jgi:hypothetical protein